MNTTRSTDNSGDILSVEHNAYLLDHLREEETSLAILLDAVRAVWQSLVARDDEKLGPALEAEARGFQMCEVMRDRRRQFCHEIAAALNIAPEQVSLSRWLEGTSIETREE